MENKNLIAAVILSVAFLFIWSTFVMPKYMPKPVPGNGAPTAPAVSTASGGASLEPAHAHSMTTEAAATTVLRDGNNEIVFSSKGGAIEHWRLKLKGQEIDLVEKPAEATLPLATFPDTTFTLRPQANQATAQATLPNGLRLTKTITLDPNSYLHTLSFRFDNPTGKPVDVKGFDWGWGPGLGTAAGEQKENSRLIRALSKGKLKAHALKPGDYPDLGEWAAIDNRYFLVAFLPVNAGQPRLNVTGTKDNTVVKIIEDLTVPANGAMTLQYQLYAGPKGYTQLSHYHKGLEASVDFGVFSWLGKLILRVIYWLQEKTGNFGWAIVILTCMLQILLFPLTVKSFKATLAMKRLQPQIAALQKNYKSDPKRLNIEMMNLYKRSGTNPFGGCLPMVLQLPIFWALFTTLRNAYELRGAPWIGWIHDLSAPDRFHVLPVIMGIGMFFQQRLSGAVTDPTQRQMMYMMPVIFTVMFFNFPAGLVLYWLTNNIVTMIFQYTMMRKQQKPDFELVK
jgi:YidC/Oxa1 family membrane protein insertase